ncbi:MAG: helix-turn-helix domain-containing protein [Candidatus Hydrogenedentes bacterium]|nr:helix-turn-helix domain-containing protein [Candidatus Hydrogenedentota bacterium]
MSRFVEQGIALRARREELGRTLVEAHDAIHVPIEHLRALEAGDLRALPGTAFASGFLKTYCEYLETDAAPFLYALDACTGGIRKAPIHRQAAAPTAPERPAWMTDVIAWGAVCGLMVFAWFTYTVVVRPIIESYQDRVRAGTVEVAPPSMFEIEK